MYPVALTALLYEPVVHFATSAKILNGYYEWPKTSTERNIFFREVFRLPNFWKDLYKRMSFSFVYFGAHVGTKITAWRYIYGGTSSPVEYADWNAFKILLWAQIAFIPTCWTAVPFEMAARAYYADKTWPVELRRGYTSPLNALVRILFEEGPSYLFKGGLPIILRDQLFFTFFWGFYTWLKGKLFFLRLNSIFKNIWTILKKFVPFQKICTLSKLFELIFYYELSIICRKFEYNLCKFEWSYIFQSTNLV